jgi:putative membrane protein
MPDEMQASPRDYLAAEGTFLAWVRTALALLALGFVLARFGLFLQQFNLVRPGLRVETYGRSLWFGTVLILLGVLVSVLALVRYLRLLGG